MSKDWPGKGEQSWSADEMTFVISTDEVDRHGDVVAADGWRLDAYRRNPVVLWAHDYRSPVVGKAAELWTETSASSNGSRQPVRRLLARIRFADTPFAQEVKGLYRSGYQQGVSVGFRPLAFEERRDPKTGAFQGIRFLEQELLEVSLVPVPANREALSQRGATADVLLTPTVTPPAEGVGLGGEMAGLLREAFPGAVPGSRSAGGVDLALSLLRRARQ